MAQPLDKLREEQDELLVEKRALEELLLTRGWGFFSQLVTSRVRADRSAEFSSTIKTMDDAFNSCGMRGQIAGMQFAVGLPSAYLADIEVDLERLRTAIEQERESDG